MRAARDHAETLVEATGTNQIEPSQPTGQRNQPASRTALVKTFACGCADYGPVDMDRLAIEGVATGLGAFEGAISPSRSLALAAATRRVSARLWRGSR